MRLLEPLEQSLLDGSEAAGLKILSFYTKLLQSWIAKLMRADVEPDEAKSNPVQTILPLISHCSTLVLQMLSSNPSPKAQTTIHGFLQTLANESSLALRQPQLCISIPPPLQIYLALFASPTAFTLSSVSDVLCTYKDTLEQYLPTQRESKAAMQFPKSSVAEFNGYVMDACNLLWRGRAFNMTDNNATGCLLSQEISKSLQHYVENIPVDRRYALTTFFSVSFHPALSAIAIHALRDMEDRVIADISDDEETITDRHAGPVTQRSLVQLGNEGGISVSWLDYRKEVLDVLSGLGADGLSELIRRSIKSQQ